MEENKSITAARRQKQQSTWSWSATICLLLIFFLSTTSDAFVPPPRIHQSSTHPLHVASRTDYSAFTVKELKQIIKDGPTVERGVLSKLKRKQDLIDYLEQREDEPINGATAVAVAPNGAPNGAAPNGAGLPPKIAVEAPNGAPPNGAEPNGSVPTKALKMPAIESDNLQSNDKDTDEQEPPKSNNNKSAKDRIFEQVFERYPPIRDQYQADIAAAEQQQEDDEEQEQEEEQDIRQLYHPILNNGPQINGCDMDLVFVGTASCTPGTTRGVSCTALRLNWRRRATFQSPTLKSGNNAGGFQGGTWLFDVGECTQLQVQRTSSVKPSKITKLFLTHAHGDHTFGVPGLLCLMGQDRDRSSSSIIDIYGPEGLRKWLRVAIRYSVSRIVPPYRVHELKEIPMAPEWEFSARTNRYFYKGLGKNSRSEQRKWGTHGLSGEDPNAWISQADRIRLDPSPMFGEVQGGRDIYPDYGHPLANDDAPVWEVEDEDDVRVYAAPMSHGIPCVGYVVQESSRPGRLRNELVQPMVERNLQALKESGFRIPMKAMAVIKNLPVGSAFTFPDGTSITQEEAVEPPRKGRKVVICGDTANCRAMEVLAKDCDVLVHEATNSYLPGLDQNTNLRMVTRDAVIHGHSTPEIAGLFAKKVNAKRLLLNHFSARYKGDPSVESMSIMMRIEQFVMAASGLDESNVAAAWDLMVLPIPSSTEPIEE